MGIKRQMNAMARQWRALFNRMEDFELMASRLDQKMAALDEATTRRFERLGERVSQLEGRLGELDSRPTIGTWFDEMKSANNRLRILETENQALRDRLDTVEEQTASLEGQLDRMSENFTLRMDALGGVVHSHGQHEPHHHSDEDYEGHQRPIDNENFSAPIGRDAERHGGLFSMEAAAKVGALMKPNFVKPKIPVPRMITLPEAERRVRVLMTGYWSENTIKAVIEALNTPIDDEN